MGQLLVPRPLPGKLPEKLRLRIKMIASGQMLLNMQKASFMSDKLSPISHGDGSIVGEGGQKDYPGGVSFHYFSLFFYLLKYFLCAFLQPSNLYL